MITNLRKLKFIVLLIFIFLPFLVNSASTSTTTTTPTEIEKPNGFFPLGNGASTIFEDDFNSYNSGNLDGQGGWTGHSEWQVQGSVVYEGAKALSNVGAGYWTLIEKSGASSNDGKMTIYVRKTTTGLPRGPIIYLYEEGSKKLALALWEDATFWYYNGSDWVSFGSYSADTWHQIEIEWRSVDHKFRFSIDDGDWTEWDTGDATWTSGLDKIVIGLDDVVGQTSYIDYIAENPYEEEPPLPEFFELIENATTGAEFFVRKTISYGKIIIILLLLLLLIFEIIKFPVEIVIPQKLNFKK